LPNVVSPAPPFITNQQTYTEPTDPAAAHRYNYHHHRYHPNQQHRTRAPLPPPVATETELRNYCHYFQHKQFLLHRLLQLLLHMFQQNTCKIEMSSITTNTTSTTICISACTAASNYQVFKQKQN
jgi:hypothetical protein